MLLSDVVRVLGGSPLKEFPWGAVVAETINLFTGDGYQLSGESTGNDVENSLNSLEHNAREIVLSANLDVSLCRIIAPMGGNMTLEYDEAETEGSIPPIPMEDIDEPDFSNVVKSPTFILSSVVVFMVVISSLIMTSRLGHHKDTDWIGAVIEIFGMFGIDL